MRVALVHHLISHHARCDAGDVGSEVTHYQPPIAIASFLIEVA